MKRILGTVLTAAIAVTLVGCVVDAPRGYQQPYHSGGDYGYSDGRDDDRHDHRRRDRDDDRRVKIVCASKDGRPNRCRADFRIKYAEVDKRYSNSPCTYGRSWGYDGNEIWVDRGCRARFSLTPAGRWR